MTRAQRIVAIIGGLLALAGVLLAVLPKDWIEESFGVEPDAGNGLVELTIVVVPVVLGAALAARVGIAVRARRAHAAGGPAPGAGELGHR